jgi:hypothetical protein
MVPLANWHTVVLGWNVSGGQSGVEPEHTSCMSQVPLFGRQTDKGGLRLYLQITPVDVALRQKTEVLLAHAASGTPAVATTEEQCIKLTSLWLQPALMTAKWNAV